MLGASEEGGDGGQKIWRKLEEGRLKCEKLSGRRKVAVPGTRYLPVRNAVGRESTHAIGLV